MPIMMRKALFTEKQVMLSYFKNKVIEHLKTLKDDSTDVKKAFGIGTIRIWNGKKHIKGADKKWRRLYDKEDRGARMSVKHLIRKVEAIDNVEDLLKLVLLHGDRFKDQNGNSLPLLQELSRYVKQRQGNINAPVASTTKKPERKVGDRYVEKQDSGKYAVRIAREDGNDGFAASGGGGSYGGLFAGVRTFDTAEAAQEWIDKNPVKEKKKAELPQSNKDFIEQNKDRKPDAKGYLYGKDGSCIKLIGLNLEYYNSLQVQGKTEKKNRRSRSEAMQGNQNAKKDGVSEEIAASRQMKIEQKEEKQARKEAGMPPTELFMGSSAMDDSTWDPKSKDYRYKDTGYIAGSRKEMAAMYIKTMAKDGNHVNERDIDWQAIEENPRQAKQLITKSNIFGSVDWTALREGGMSGGAGFLIDRVYAAVGTEPKEDNANARHNYSIAIDGLRERLEVCKTVVEVTDTIKEIRGEMNGDFVTAREAPEVAALSEKLDELYKKRAELKAGEEKLSKYSKEYIPSKYDIKAMEFFVAEVEKVKAKDKRKKRVYEFDFPREVREEYNRLVIEADSDRAERILEYRKQNGYLDDLHFTDETGTGHGWKTRGYLYDEITALKEQRDNLYEKKASELILSNPLHAAWTQLGSKFQSVLQYGTRIGSNTFYDHVSQARRGKYDNWEWANKEKIEVSRKGQKRRVEFELKVASRMERKGGRDIQSQSTLELKKNFNLRDVQSGKWVLNDPESAKFHVDNITAGFADLGDITGIPDNLLSMNGRLAIAIGARGTGSAGFKVPAVAHYESVERVINLTKMKGGGSLAHEWFHSFDNLISEAITGGSIDKFLTDPNAGLTKAQLKLKAEVEVEKQYMDRTGHSYSVQRYKDAVKAATEAGVYIPQPGSEEEHIEKVKSAFNNLVEAMVTGTVPLQTLINYTAKDYEKAKYNMEHKTPTNLCKLIHDAGSMEKALDIVYSRNLNGKDKKDFVAITVAWYDKNPNGNTVYTNSGEKGSSFRKAAKDLDGGGGKPYYSQNREMAARAFSAYIDDKLRGNERLNDYLAYATTNDFYDDPVFGPSYPYPEGEERERINAAFDELFKVVNETGAIRKAVEAEGEKVKIVFLKKAVKPESKDDDRLGEFKRIILEHLTGSVGDDEEIKKAGLPIGTVRNWKGKEVIKVGPRDWRPKYNSESRGAKMAVAAIKKKVDAAKTAKELLDIVQKNRDRFSDAQGNPLPFIQELSRYVAERQEYLPENIKARRKEARSNAIKEGQKKARDKKEAAKRAADENIKQKAERLKKQAEQESGKADDAGEKSKLQSLTERMGELYREGKSNSPEMDAVYKEYQEVMKESRNKDNSEADPAYDDSEKKETENQSDSQDDIDFREMRDKYQGGKSVEGQEDEIYIGNESQKGRWKLVEADAPSASHNETTFHKTRGFPKNKDGSTINDRDYQNDRAAQETVMSMGSNFDGRALSFDSPIVVTKDGVVVSGNNRTMSSKIAAKKGADTKYIDALKKRAVRFGFSSEDVDGFRHPRVVFEIEKDGDYSTGEFAKYNQESQKTMSPLEAAVKVSKIIKPETVKDIAGNIVDFETMGELYSDRKTCMSIFNSLENGGIINQFNRNSYIDPDGTITGAGKEFLETVLIGSVVNEQNIRGLNREGCKSIRQKLVRAITPLINNKSMGGYSIMEELNQAVDLFMQYNIEKDKFGSLDELIKQGAMFEAPSEVAVELARKMQMTQKDFAGFMQTINASLEMGASGQSDIFLGDVETKDDILKRFLDMKKAIKRAVNKALHFYRRGMLEKRPREIIKGGETVIEERYAIVDPLDTEKSLTWSGHKLQGRTKVHGMDISIENKKGSVRSGTDKDGHSWSIKMGFDYGYIRGTVGKDKDHLDAYIGPNPESEAVFIVHQNDPSTGAYDEDKVMLGFDTLDEAKEAYLSQYDRPGFLGDIGEMDIDTFKEKAFDEKNRGKKIK